MGSYDITPTKVVHLIFDNCTQTTDILNSDYWEIMGSNYCKDIVVNNCIFSRFDAHKGVTNVTISGSTLGHQGLNAIGEGLLKVENSTLYGSSFISLRSDYGSTWRGNVEIKNCTWEPKGGNNTSNASLIYGKFTGKHDLGYDCYMPEDITIDGLTVKDSSHTNTSNPDYGIYLLGNIIEDYKSDNYGDFMQYKYNVTKTIYIKNYHSATNKKLALSANQYMYKKKTTVYEE